MTTTPISFTHAAKQAAKQIALTKAQERADIESNRKWTLQVAKDAGVQTVHIFDKDWPKGGLTIAYRKSSPYKSGVMVDVAVATCSDQDTFNKKLGTQLALEYFFDGKTIQLPLVKLFTNLDMGFAVKRAFSALYDVV